MSIQAAPASKKFWQLTRGPVLKYINFHQRGPAFWRDGGRIQNTQWKTHSHPTTSRNTRLQSWGVGIHKKTNKKGFVIIMSFFYSIYIFLLFFYSLFLTFLTKGNTLVKIVATWVIVAGSVEILLHLNQYLLQARELLAYIKQGLLVARQNCTCSCLTCYLSLVDCSELPIRSICPQLVSTSQ